MKPNLQHLGRPNYHLLLMMLLALLALSGCSQLQPIYTKAKPAANALVKCDSLTAPTAGASKDGYIDYLLGAYYVCAVRHDFLVRANQ